MHTFNKILVTGAGGLIGSAVCNELASRSYNVRAMLAPHESEKSIIHLNDIEMIRADIRNKNAVLSAMKKCDACIHLAALNKLYHKPKDDFYSINFEGTKNICSAAKELNLSKLVFTSSCEVMGRAEKNWPTNENHPIDTKSLRGHYEISKFLAEQHVRNEMSSGLPATIIRPTSVIGPNDINSTPSMNFLRSLIKGKTKLYYNAKINIVDSRDVARIHVDALKNNHTGKTFIAGGHNTDISNLFQIISKKTGIASKPIKIGYSTAYTGILISYVASRAVGIDPIVTPNAIKIVKNAWHFNTTKIENELNFSATNIEETLADIIGWLKKNGEI